MRMLWLTHALAPWAMRLAASRPPDFSVIQGPERLAYLHRWWVWPRNRWCNLYLHNMVRDDDPILHDHMYWSVSLCLSGHLLEWLNPDPRHMAAPRHLTRNNRYGPIISRAATAGSVVLRSPRLAHQLCVVEEAWTLFLTGPRIRDWGFWCPQGWRLWSDYVALGDGTSGRGRGCGEEVVVAPPPQPPGRRVRHY